MGLVGYCIGYEGDVTLEGIQERAASLPLNDIRNNILEYRILHRIVGGSYATLDIVKYLLELAPDAANQVDEGGIGGDVHPYGRGSYPLHLACFNVECPVTIVVLLLERCPSAIKHSWTDMGLPLHCYIERARKQDGWGQEEEDGLWVEYCSGFPSGDLDYDIVKRLVESYPEGLTDVSSSSGTPMHILCSGNEVTLELAHLLTDRKSECIKAGLNEKSGLPILNLLWNHGVKPFPTDVFNYLLDIHPSLIALSERGNPPSGDDSYSSGDDSIARDYIATQSKKPRKSPLHIACSNPNISVEVVESILALYPEMVKDEYTCDGIRSGDGTLPIHRLCRNEDLDNQTSLDLLKLLVRENPESVEKRVNIEGMPFFWVASDDLPIHLACANMSFNFCKLLLELNPASVSERVVHYRNSTELRGSSMLPFHLACSYGSLNLVKYLLEKRPPDIHKKTRDENYKYDEMIGVDELVKVDELALKKGNWALHLAACRENCSEKMEIMNFLLQQDPDAASKIGKYGNMPLHRACRYPSAPT
ncbi:hypothetical protein ACHAWF_015829 [Thalassiosira exigua]